MNKLAFNQRAIIRSLSAAVIVLDEANRVTLWNLAAERLLGITEAEAQGQLFWTLNTPALNRANLTRMRKSLAQNVATRLDDVTYELPGGSEGKALLMCVPIVENGSSLGAVIIFEDVTRLANLVSENAKLKDNNGKRTSA
jgi:two-component system, chemotaxis family, CheB/CheR fusion protein